MSKAQSPFVCTHDTIPNNQPLSYPTGSPMAYPSELPPPVPFTTYFPYRLTPGKMFRLRGIPTYNPTRFTVNLSCGPDPANNYALHFDVRFNFGSSRNVVVRTDKRGPKYGSEERNQHHFPFFPGKEFNLVIQVESDCFRFVVDGQYYGDFKHRMPAEHANHIMVLGDVIIHQLSFV